MRYSVVIRYFIVILLVAGCLLPVFAQSGRRRQTPPSTNKQTQNPKSAEEAEESEEREDEKKSASHPLADNTPTTVSDDGTIKLETTLITIPVSVLDRDGRFLPNLRKRNFRIYEDGVEQQIASFESVEVPFHVVLLLDTSSSARFKHEDIQAAAADFVKQLRWNDQVMVVSFDSTVSVWCDFTSDREQIRQAIYRTRTGGSTKLYEAVDLSLSEWLGPIEGRKAIVLFTDGVDTTSRRSSARSTVSLVEEMNTLVYPIHYDTEFDDPQGGVIMGNPRGTPFPWPSPRRPRSPTPGGGNPRWPFPLDQFVNFQIHGKWPQGRVPLGDSEDYRDGKRYLQDLADRSGGRFYSADTNQDLSDAFSLIAEELRHQYAISYYPTNAARDGTYRKIKVRVNRPNVFVRARDGYRAVSSTEAKSANPYENRKKPGYKRKQVAGTN
jgi:Ca-activated chloride channel homolog